MSEWPSTKRLQTINAGQDLEKREHFYTALGSTNWYSNYREQYGGSLKNIYRNKSIIQPSNSTTGHISQENHNLKRHMHPNIHCTAIHDTQDMEAT